jgi:transcriptional regulator with XRE-family HTH domain
MEHELNEINRIRLEEDRSYNELAREMGFKDTSILHKLLNGKSHPSERSMFKIRRFLDARQHPRRRKAS